MESKLVPGLTVAYPCKGFILSSRTPDPNSHTIQAAATATSESRNRAHSQENSSEDVYGEVIVGNTGREQSPLPTPAGAAPSPNTPHIQDNKNRNENDPVFHLGRYTFKQAQTKDEYKAIHHLNYRTFVREIPQHTDPGNGELVDKFHDKNTYFIAMRDGTMAGMVSVHDQPPFSIESRLPDTDILRELHGRLMEIRLLAVEPNERHSLVFAGLLWSLYNYALDKGYTHLLISGVSERVRLYKRLGFHPIGEAVIQGEASFVPMVLDMNQIPDEVIAREPMWTGKMKRAGDDSVPMAVIQRNGNSKAWQNQHDPSTPDDHQCETLPDNQTDASSLSKPIFSFLPGPVQIEDRVIRAFAEPPISHRDIPFIRKFERTRRILSELVGGFQVAIMPGSGTLANDVIAANLAADRDIKRGIVLVNGEFGYRLVNQVRRFGLDADILEYQWGKPWNFDQIADALRENEEINWIWGVHLESSTGMVNDIQQLRHCAEDTGRVIKVCCDCVSSLGSIPINATGLHLVSGASGKSLGSFAGVSIIFAPEHALDTVDVNRVPNYYDARAWIETDGPRFTFPSPLLLALDAALDRYATVEARNEKFSQYEALGQFVRRELRRLGVNPLVDGENAAPVITSFDTPFNLSCKDFLTICRGWGYELSGLSKYLAKRQWAQIATMGNMTIRDCAPFFTYFEAWLSDHKKSLS